MQLPFTPPSDNNAYINDGYGGRKLSAEGRKFKTEALAHLAQNYPSEMRFFEKDNPYLVYIRVGFPSIYNESWPKKAKRRYKHLDARNRSKLCEDVLAEAAGIDDDQNLVVVIEKCESSMERTQIAVWNREKEGSPFDAGLRWFAT